MVDNVIEIVPNSEGNYRTPNYLTFDEEGNIYIGDAAMSIASHYPTSTVFDIQKLIGHTQKGNFKDRLPYWPFEVTVKTGNVFVGFLTENKKKLVPVEEISGLLLYKLKADAEAFLNRRVEQVIFSVPSQFHFKQREALKSIAETVGLHTFKFINEQ